MASTDDGYTYDVFVSYSHADATWVREWLLRALEREKLRVCIDFRDFEVGAPSLVNMERAVDTSRRNDSAPSPALRKAVHVAAP